MRRHHVAGHLQRVSEGEAVPSETLTTAMHDHWLWYLKGLGGILRMAQEYSDSTRSVPATADQIELLELHAKQLQAIAQHEREKRNP